MHEGRKCKITNIGDPHLFFVLYDEERGALKDLESLLEKNFVNTVEPIPKKDQIYVVKHEGRLKRAVALTKSQSFYCCWLVDYGELAWENVFYTLPPGCDMKPLSIKAGLNKTVELESYVSELGAIEFKTSRKFSPGASHSIKQQINKATEIYFKEECIIRNVYFGQVYLRLNDGRCVNLISNMEKDKVIAVDGDFFNEVVSRTMEVDEKKRYSAEDGAGLGRGYSRNNRKSLPKATTSNKEHVQNWLSSTMHELLILTDSCSPKTHKATQDTENNAAQTNTDDIPYYSPPPANKNTDKPKKCGIMRELQEKVKSSMAAKKLTAENDLVNASKDDFNKSETDSRKSTASIKLSPEDIIRECKSNNSSIISAIRKMKSQSAPSSSELSVKATSESDCKSGKFTRTDSEDESDCSYIYKNEKSMVKKFRCDCIDCRNWDAKDFNTKEEEFRTRKVKPVVKPALLFKSADADESPCLKSLSELNEFPTSKKIAAPSILVHGTVIPHPQKYVTDIPFIAPIHKSLQYLKHEKCLHVQQYGWPAIMRSMNLCMVNVANSGKTTTYVAAISSLLMEADRYQDLPRKETGPIALVLCSESNHVEKVYRRFQDVYFNCKTQIKLRVVQAIAPLNPALMSHFKHACDILITTPAVLIALLSRNIFNLKRLCHLVVEDIDEMLRCGKPLARILGVVNDMLKHRVCAKQVQFICTAEHWTHPVENLLKQLASVPLIVIGNPIESALYGRADISIKEVQTNAKQSVLYDIIKDQYRVYKTVIVCSKNEIKPIQELFQLYGIGMLIADESMSGEDISEIQKSWSSRSGGDRMVLICTDFVLRTHMNITDCSILVNYSLQATWPHFVKRWSCLIDNYKSPLNTNQDHFNCKIFVFIDEQSGKEIAKIINYFQTVGIKLPPKITDYYEKYKETSEIQKIQNKAILCPTWKHTTNCKSANCPHRHILNPELDTNHLNMSGTLKFDIDYIRDINSFQITPLQFETSTGEVHKIHNTKPEVDRLLKEVKMTEFVVNITVGEMYVLEEEAILKRCIVRRIVDYDSITKIPSRVVVEGVDSGFYRRVSTSILFELPDNLRGIPSTLMNLIIVNIVPLNNEKAWSDRARKQLINALEENRHVKVYGSGNIALVLSNTIWMENFQMNSQLTYLKQVVTCFTLLPYLTQQNFVKVDKSQLTKFYEECEKYNVAVPKYDVKTELKAAIKQPEPQWAFFPDQTFNAVTFSSGFTPRSFFVKLQKFSDISSKFNTSIQELIKHRSLQINLEDITVGNCYLAPDPEMDHVYSRAIVTDIREDTADCFYVDYGDVAYIPLNKIKFLPNDYITKLPFQCIECGLHGVDPLDDEWSDDALDILYKYCFENNSNYFRTLYTMVMKEEAGSYSGNKKYIIQLYDYSDNVPRLINNVMVDCGLAIPNPEEPFNHETKLALLDDQDQDQSDLEESLKDDDKSNEENENYVELEFSGQGEPSYFDFECGDENAFFTEVGINLPKECRSNKPEQALPEMRALPVSDTATPTVDWHQVDNVIKILIKVPVTEYQVKLVAGRVLSFSADYNNKKYKLQLQLFDLVNKTFTHSPAAFSVNVVLTKLKQTAWPRLVLSTEPTRKIRYNVDKLDVSDDEEKSLLSRLKPKEESEDEDDEYYDEICTESSDSDFSVSLDSDEY